MKIKQATIDSIHKSKTSDRFNINMLIKSMGMNLTIVDTIEQLKAYDWKDGVFIFIGDELIGYFHIQWNGNVMYFKSTTTFNKLVKYIKSLITQNKPNILEII